MTVRLFKKRITSTVLLLIVILIYSGATEAQTRNKPTWAEPFKGQIYRAIDDKKVITIISPDELEFKEHDLNLVCKYSKRDDTLRVVYSMMGTTQALYFRIAPNVGLEGEDGVVLYAPKPYESVMQEIEAQRLQKYLNVEFLKASKEGDLPKLNELLSQGAEINTYDKEDMGFSALIFAAKGGHLEDVNFLLENGADPNYKTEHGITALMTAANEGGQHGFVNLPRSAEHDKIVEIPCKHSDVVNPQSIPEGYTALMHALFRNNHEAVRILINNGSNKRLLDETWTIQSPHFRCSY